jgi:hypothetical protein
MRYVIDGEGNGLLADMLDYSSFPYKLKSDAKLWCICLYNVDTGEKKHLDGENLTKKKLKEALNDCTELIGHNIIKFDFPVFMLFGLLNYYVGYLDEDDKIFGKVCKITDTLINSRLFYPDRYLGHSLETWGNRVDEKKLDFRQMCINKGYIQESDPQGAEFQQYTPEMLEYCEGDTTTGGKVFLTLEKESKNWDWSQAIKMENKLADKAIRREVLGFWFDKDLAIKCLEDLNQKMQALRDIVEPLLPVKPMNIGELKEYTPPARQMSKNGKYTSFMVKFANKHGAILNGDLFTYKGRDYKIPFTEPIETHVKAVIDNLDHVKMYLISLGWVPTEWKVRDLTKDSKKQSINYEKRMKALYKWYDETKAGKYTEERFAQLDIDRESLINQFLTDLRGDYPVRVPTSPNVRVGVEKELCPNLTALGDKVGFAKDFALYLTYKHRRNSIAGGNTEDMDFDLEAPNTGYLSMFREQDSRVSTPSIEIGASTNRYRHIGIANIARATSIYGKEMRSLFGCGPDALQLGFDFASLEARIQGHYCYNYTNGSELAKTLLAEKPNDIHTVTAKKLGIQRADAKNINYAVLYGAQITKLMKMLACSKNRATEIYNGFWENVPALKELKEKVENYWFSTDKKYILGIDGRKIFIRSKHSILNALFQSAGVIATKYSTIFMYQKLERAGLHTDPFINKPDVCSMIEYHDECQLYINPKLAKFKVFETEDEAKEFKNNWKGEQISAVTESNNNYYVTLPNVVSKIIGEAIKQTTKLLKLNVELGYEFSVGRTWYGTH